MTARTTLRRTLVAAASIAFFSSVPAQAQEYEMAIATIVPEDLTKTEIYPGLVHFASLVETRTGGDISVEIFGASQLGSEVETASQVQAGGRALQATVISSGAMSSFYGKYQAVTTPFLFENWRQAWAFFDSEWFADFMSGTVEEANMRYLGTFDDGGGFVAFTNNGKLIKTVDDLKGMNIRVEENPSHVAIMDALGASATPLPWEEVQTALGSGLADGQFNAPVVNTAFNLYEVTDYTTLTGHVYNTQTWLVSEDWYQALPEEYQRIITTSAQEAIKLSHGTAGALATASWKKSCEVFKECYIMPAEERQRMAEMARPAWKDWVVNDFGLEESLIDELWAEVEQVNEQLKAQDFERYGQ